MIPVRCFTCGKVLGSLYDDYKGRVAKGEPRGQALDGLGLRRYCCRRMLLTHVEVVDTLNKYR